MEENTKTQLVVFIHGLGADEDAWWGSTPTAVRAHPRLRTSTVHFWGYETSHLGIGWIRSLRNKLGSGETRQTIRQLGEDLWSNIRHWWSIGDFTELKVVGHSMGGLVLAAGLGREPQNALDRTILQSISSIVLIASPLGGADLANTAAIIAKTQGGNIHAEDLQENSPRRKEIVSEFVYRVIDPSGLALQPVIFRANGDSVVKQEELYEPLPANSYNLEVLDGTHSGCVQNLQANSNNLSKILLSLGFSEENQNEIAPDDKDLPTTASTSEKSEDSIQIPHLTRCWVLIEASLAHLYRGTLGGGPRTHLGRHLELSNRWYRIAKEQIALYGGETFLHEAIGVLDTWQTQAPNAIPRPDCGFDDEDWTDVRREDLRDLNRSIYFSHKEFEATLTALGNQPGNSIKGEILGFPGENAIAEYLYPGITQLLSSEDPMYLDLVERLVVRNSFSPTELFAEGYRKDLVVDTLNALLEEKWAVWTDLTKTGDNSVGEITSVGVRLLQNLLATHVNRSNHNMDPKPT